MKNIILTILLVLSATQSWATNDKIAFPSFVKNEIKYVFPDFKTATYTIKYDIENKKATYQAIIKLETKENGRILFDVVSDTPLLKLNGEVIKGYSLQAPYKEAPLKGTGLHAVGITVDAGIHELVVEGEISDYLLRFSESAVKSAFWFIDIRDRHFLERYLPASFEYDRVIMNFDIEIIGTKVEHKILTNGHVAEKANNRFSISYPDFYNCSSIYFHMLPKDRIYSLEFNIKSIDERVLPVLIYSSLNDGALPTSDMDNNLANFKNVTIEKIQSLEKQFGPIPHSQIIIHAAINGGFQQAAGMEYAGATITNLAALRHELTHFYFGRGLMPANGNAGWIDEAITSWSFIPDMAGPPNNPTHLFMQQPYARETSLYAYSTGVLFISKSAGVLKKLGEKDYIEFLNYLLREKLYQPYTNEDFFAWSKEFFGFSLLDLVPSTRGDQVIPMIAPHFHEAHPAHRRFTDNELRELL